ncbi:MAG: zf-HC2 domain-containing protein [Planctomycetaceae bacterium]
MTLDLTPCDDDPIIRLLGDRLSERELAEFEQHLEQCSTCTKRLALLAADGDFWNDTQFFLSSVEQPPAIDAPTISYTIDANGLDGVHHLAHERGPDRGRAPINAFAS